MLGLVVAAVAAVALTAGMGVIVSGGLDSVERVRGNGGAPPAPDRVETAPRDGGQVPVLCYHYLRGKSNPWRLIRVFGYVVLSLPLLDDSELWTTSVTEFERHMAYLKARGYHTVTLDELHEWQMGRRDLPRRSVAITFDDGDQSVYDLAYPILKQHGFRATLFVVTARVGTRWNEVRCLDWPRLRELHESGVFQIESHTNDMHFKVDAGGIARPVFVAASEHEFEMDGAADWEDAVRADLARSRDAIERRVGRAPRFLAWPYGSATAHLDRLAFEAGFVRTCALRARTNRRRDVGQLWFGAGAAQITRYTVTARTSLRTFRRMVEGTYSLEV
jgi:peptidoglycan/xylan/chitin deacetylase (PgdA/CDA1 family)